MPREGYEESSPGMPDLYDRTLTGLHEAQHVTSTKPSTLRHIPPLGVGGSTSYNVTTYRKAGDIIEETEGGDVKRGPSKFTAFIEVGHGTTLTRIVLPDEVLSVLLRQRDSLNTSAAKASAKAVAKRRKEAGIAPGFMKRHKGRSK